jgi:hypothetical protein
MSDGTMAYLVYSNEYCLSIAAKRPIINMSAAMLPKSAFVACHNRAWIGGECRVAYARHG